MYIALLACALQKKSTPNLVSSGPAAVPQIGQSRCPSIINRRHPSPASPSRLPVISSAPLVSHFRCSPLHPRDLPLCFSFSLFFFFACRVHADGACSRPAKSSCTCFCLKQLSTDPISWWRPRHPCPATPSVSRFRLGSSTYRMPAARSSLVTDINVDRLPSCLAGSPNFFVSIPRCCFVHLLPISSLFHPPFQPRTDPPSIEPEPDNRVPYMTTTPGLTDPRFL